MQWEKDKIVKGLLLILPNINFKVMESQILP